MLDPPKNLLAALTARRACAESFGRCALEEQRVKPSGWFYVLGLAIFVFGCAAAIALFAAGMVGTAASAVEVDRLINSFDHVIVPGSAELALDEPGAYVAVLRHQSACRMADKTG
jgi:hypothetical protein